MFVEGLDRELGLQSGVVEAEGAIAGGGEDMCRVCFGVGDIIERVLRRIPSQAFDTLHTELENEESPISHQAVVGARCYRNAVVEER